METADALARLPKLAGYVSRRLPPTVRATVQGDLVSEGAVAVLTAAQTFDATRGCAFRTYALTRAKGAMRDWLRWHRRIDGYARGVSVPMVAIEAAATVAAPDPSPYAAYWCGEQMAGLTRILDRAQGRERVILDGVRRGQTHPQLARQLGVSASRISQLAARAITQARAEMYRGVAT